MLVGVALVAGLISGQFAERADGGFDTTNDAVFSARRRIAVLEAPQFVDGTFRVTDSLEAHTELKLQLRGAPRLAGTSNASKLVYGSSMELEQVNEQTFVFRIGGRFDFSVDTPLPFQRIDARTAQFGSHWRISTQQPLEASVVGLGGGASGVITELRLELSVATSVDLALTGGHGAPALWGSAMAWDPARQRLMRFGGATNSSGAQCGTCEHGSTWVLSDGGEWVALNIPGPSARVRATLTWDPVRQVMVLFGGGSDGVRLDDTWEFTANGWVERTPTHRPPVRWGHAAIWFPARGRVVMFGGFNSPGSSGTEYDDLWEWDGTDWVEVPPPMVRPSARDSHGLVFDENLGEVLLIGGWDGFTSLNDVWAWNGARWQLLQFGAPFPARCSLNVAWDPVNRRVVVAGGWAPEFSFAQMFEDSVAFDGSRWRSAGLLPLPAHRIALASHPELGIVGFGGKGASETFGWTLTPSLPRWTTLPAFLPTGPVSNRAPVALVWRGTSLRAAAHHWSSAGAVPFASTLELVDTGLGGVALAPDDAGVAVWEQSPDWALLDAAPSLALAGDVSNEDVWLAREDGALRVRRAGVWEDGGELPADAGVLAAVSNGLLYLRGDEVNLFEPASGLLQRIAPAPFAEPYTLRYDPRRDVLLASRPGDASVLEWHDGAWVLVSTVATNHGWSGGPPWRTISTSKRLTTYEPLRGLGAACREGRQCASSFCADGVCCESACDTSECVMCSVAAGGARDGQCTTARSYGIARCGSDDPCFVRTCQPFVELCPAPVNVCMPDAGEPTVPDAGDPMNMKPAVRRPAIDASFSPALCRCSSAEGALALVALAGLLRRRRA